MWEALTENCGLEHSIWTNRWRIYLQNNIILPTCQIIVILLFWIFVNLLIIPFPTYYSPFLSSWLIVYMNNNNISIFKTPIIIISFDQQVKDVKCTFNRAFFNLILALMIILYYMIPVYYFTWKKCTFY